MSTELRSDRPDALALGPAGAVVRCHVSCHCDPWAEDEREMYTVRAQGPWGVVGSTRGDAFGALVEVRLQLEPLGWLLALAGARRDVWPSGMLRGAGGEEGYLLLPHAVGGNQPLVPIFDDAPAELVVSVAEQQAAYNQWLEQRRSRA
ncbi:hypothetical protein P3T37_002690 [Kitasatospora sp. MAA4]|uniref:hypothetical protein n=1 Tax=Kitasatospora sp. MAA4 TaxID=3035093 RepID=UPI002475DD3B|nr:hypothetical protein [Kitasatospora sp. MAA4]MDH6133295.1 hypothetical protein [Kitasatospora sp. MAA4]